MNRTTYALMGVVLFCLLFTVAGCGEEAPTPGDAIAAPMAGAWEGNVLLLANHATDNVGSGVTVNLTTLTRASIIGLCPGADTPFDVVGAGTQLSWAGAFYCPPALFHECPDTVAVFTSATVGLYSGTSLNIEVDGTATGCDVTYPIHITFDGFKE